HLKSRTRLFIAVTASAIFIVGFIFIYSSLPTTETKRTFKFSSPNGSTPTFLKASIDPSDVKVGDIQTFSVVVSDQDGVVSVFAVTELDTRVKEIALFPAEDGDTPCVECIWEGSWEVNDTSNKTYITNFIAENTLGDKQSVSISWTDPCSPPQSGPWTLDGNCAISTTNGLEQGAFTIPSDKTLTLQNGGTWVYQEGYPISIIGTIAIEEGGRLLRSLLWVLDNDADGYAPSTTQVASLTQPTNYIRKKDATGFDDCYDANANAKSGQTSYFTSNRGDGSYDYNCNGANDKQWTQTTSCTYGGKGVGSSSGIGWSGGIPACGAAGTYYVNTSCGAASRTQACR
ncbi:MAG: hypothetical protein JKX80_02290, partial [Candidatus Pacebacteria bacterium]|nr:hypothetical protein [Candidatus Paceibacterota bacterium]